jgi:hypothetical protein
MSMEDDIRQGLENVLNGIESIKSASGWPMEQVNAVPAVFVGFIPQDVTMANLELSLWRVPVTFLVQRKAGNLKNQVKAVAAVVDDFKVAIRAHQDLGLPTLVSGMRYERFDPGIYAMGNVDYVGVIARLTIKTTEAVSFG